MLDNDVEELEQRFRTLKARREILINNVQSLTAEHNARKRSLKEALDEAKEKGFNPENMAEELRKCKEILSLKIDNFEADLSSGEDIVKPMLKEIGI